jgi:predicted transcriptional regulator
MDTLWDNGGWMTPSEVHIQLQAKRPLAYTTVTTVLVRLWEKSRLERRKVGRAFAYHPTSTRPEWAAGQMANLLVAVGDRKAALTHFLDGLDARDRSQLQKLLADKKK